MSLYRNTYRVETTRLPEWDYADSAWYYVTICANERAMWFGEVRDGIMGLSEAGVLAHQFWEDIPEHAQGVVLDSFIVMPNHVHGIIGLLPKDDEKPAVETLHATSLPTRGEMSGQMSGISPSAGSLSAIIRSYKSAVTREVRRSWRTGFGWQPRFHDRIIRNDRELNAIREYIDLNPARWSEDRLNPRKA